MKTAYYAKYLPTREYGIFSSYENARDMINAIYEDFMEKRKIKDQHIRWRTYKDGDKVTRAYAHEFIHGRPFGSPIAVIQELELNAKLQWPVL